MQTLFVTALLFATSFPSSSKTSWMSPQSFHLIIGMPRAQAVKTLEESGWELKPGPDDNQLIVDYSGDKAMTLEFVKDRLRSVRFELFALLPEIRAAFSEQKALLQREHGEPRTRVRSDSVVVYNDRLPNIMVVLKADANSDYGKKGFGYLAVRYYDPR